VQSRCRAEWAKPVSNRALLDAVKSQKEILGLIHLGVRRILWIAASAQQVHRRSRHQPGVESDAHPGAGTIVFPNWSIEADGRAGLLSWPLIEAPPPKRQRH
jgi:hypothetical protein